MKYLQAQDSKHTRYRNASGLEIKISKQVTADVLVAMARGYDSLLEGTFTVHTNLVTA